MRRIAAGSGALAGLLVMAASAGAAEPPPLKVPPQPTEVIVATDTARQRRREQAARNNVDASSARRMLLPDTQVLRVAHRAQPVPRAASWSSSTPSRGRSRNRIVKGGAAATDDPNFGELWGLRNTGQTVDGRAGVAGVDVNALSAWDTTRGAGAAWPSSTAALRRITPDHPRRHLDEYQRGPGQRRGRRRQRPRRRRARLGLLGLGQRSGRLLLRTARTWRARSRPGAATGPASSAWRPRPR